MAVAAASVWQAAWAAECKPVSDDSWKANLANYINARTSSLLTTSGLLKAGGAGAMLFTFGKSAFQGALGSNQASALASAFEAGVLASTILVEPGAFVGSDSPATKFSVVTTSIVNPASLAAAKAKILEVNGLPATPNANQSQFPLKLREAFLLLKIDTVGLDSTVPPAGPLPLSDLARSVA